MSERQGDSVAHRASDRERSTETKAATKTTELIVYVVAVLAIWIAGYVVDGYNATEVWTHFTYLTVGYMISRGLAKAGSREPYRD